MVCLAGLEVLPRYYCSRAPLPLSPVSKGNPMSAHRFSIENQKPRLQIFFACGALFRVYYPATFRRWVTKWNFHNIIICMHPIFSVNCQRKTYGQISSNGGGFV